RDGRVTAVELADGFVLDARVVVLACGVLAGAGGACVPAAPVRPGEGEMAEGERVTVEEGATEEADGVGGAVEGGGGVAAGGVVGATITAEPAGASAPWASGPPGRAHAPANKQVRADPRTRARALRSAGVTG
ncbi:hypothetical protein ACWCPG_22160, partial [Streptomyces sp. NPDC001919]